MVARALLLIALCAAACSGSASGSAPGAAAGAPSGSSTSGTLSASGAPSSDAAAGEWGVPEGGARPDAEASAPPPVPDSSAPDAPDVPAPPLAFADDFEADTAGQPPSGAWTVKMGCDPATAANPSGMTDGPAPGGGLYVGIDTAESLSGRQSLRVVGGDSCGYYAAVAVPPALGSDVYVRLWARFSAPPTQGHNGFLSMPTTSMAAQHPDQLRLGFQNAVIEWNWFGNDATLPDTDPQGAAQSVAPAAAAWVCLELHLDASTGAIDFWYGGAATPTPGLSWTGAPAPAPAYQASWAASGFKAGIAPTALEIGWAAFNGGMMTVWFDDVALAASRIGCN